MNTFFEYEDIYGRVDTRYLSRTTREIFELISEIRGRLGKQGYLLDNYVCKLLEGMSEMNALASMERARSLTCDFNGLVSAAMTGNTENGVHPLYEKSREYIEAHPLDYQEETTRNNIYSIALLDDFLEIEAERYRKELKKKLTNVFDNIDIKHLERDIGRIAGGLYVERLNLFLRQRFLLATPMAAFAQGLTDELLHALTHRDDETSKMIVQLWGDAIAMKDEGACSNG